MDLTCEHEIGILCEGVVVKATLSMFSMATQHTLNYHFLASASSHVRSTPVLSAYDIKAILEVGKIAMTPRHSKAGNSSKGSTKNQEQKPAAIKV